MKKHASHLLIFVLILVSARAEGQERSNRPAEVNAEQVRVKLLNETTDELSRRGSNSHESASSSRIQLVISRSGTQVEVIDANEPSRRLVFPWIALARDYALELHLYNPSGGANRTYSASGQPAAEAHVLEEKLGETEVIIPPSAEAAYLMVWGDQPLIAYIVWKRDGGEVEWIDQGERLPDEEIRPAEYQIVVEGAPAGLQVEITGKSIISLYRVPSLPPSVSLSSHIEAGMLRAAWIATNLQPIEDRVLGIVRVSELDAAPEIRGWMASDPQGNAIPVQVYLIRTH